MNKIPKFQLGNTLNVNPYTNFLAQGLGDSQKWYNAGIKNRFNLGDTTKSPLNIPYKFDPASLLKKPIASSTASGKTDWLSKAFTSTPSAKGLNVAGQAFDIVGSFSKPLDHVSGASKGLDVAGDIAAMVPGPGGQGISAGLKAIKLVDKLTGKKAATQATEGATATGYNLDFNPNAGTSYGGLFGNKRRKQTNRLTGKQDISNIGKIGASRNAQQQMLAATNLTQDITNKNYQKLSGGIGTNILAAKEGLKLIKQQAVLLMKEGGTFNVIPSGALHAHKHNLPDEVADGLTKKGIPVIMEEGGEITQQAEIERNEIIFNLDLTKKLESLLKKYEEANENEKNDILIIAGKLLTYEILENTVDNTNIIDTI